GARPSRASSERQPRVPRAGTATSRSRGTNDLMSSAQTATKKITTTVKTPDATLPGKRRRCRIFLRSSMGLTTRADGMGEPRDYRTQFKLSARTRGYHHLV